MTIDAVIPSAAAAAPSHPDHAQWVKHQMLEREVNWLRSLGAQVPGREVEQRIDAGLQRMAARKREKRNAPTTERTVTPMRTAEQLAARSGAQLIRRPVRKQPPPVYYACRRCGSCLRCRRELRGQRILALARQGDTRAHGLAMDIVKAGLRAQARIGIFEHLSAEDADRAITRVVEDVCDRSVSFMGPWRP